MDLNVGPHPIPQSLTLSLVYPIPFKFLTLFQIQYSLSYHSPFAWEVLPFFPTWGISDDHLKPQRHELADSLEGLSLEHTFHACTPRLPTGTVSSSGSSHTRVPPGARVTCSAQRGLASVDLSSGQLVKDRKGDLEVICGFGLERS